MEGNSLYITLLEGVIFLRNILNNNLLRHLNFLEILYKEDNWIPIGNIAKILQCSEKILRNDIKLINEEFIPFQIETSLKGIKLTYPINYSSEYIYQKILYLSPEFAFIEHVFFEENHNVEAIAEELFISTSTLRRIISKINNTLNHLGITITTNPCKITGDEGSIRCFIIQLFYEKYGVTNVPFSSLQVKILDRLLIYITQKNNVNLNFPDLCRLRYWIMVNLVRIRNGNTKIIEEEFPDSIDASILNNKFYCRIFKRIFHIELNKENAHQLFYIFLNKKYAFTYEQLEAMMKSETSARITVCKVKNFLYTISEKLEIPLQNEQTIIVELFNLHNLFNGPNYVLNEKGKVIEENKHEFSYFLQIIKSELKKVKFYDNFEWETYYLNETLYILIIHWTNLFNILANRLGTIKIGLFCDSDIEHTLCIKEIIDYQFGDHVQTHVIDQLSIKAFKKDALQYELIITNMSGIQDIPIPIICIDTIPYYNDFKKIQNMVYSLLKEKRQLI